MLKIYKNLANLTEFYKFARNTNRANQTKDNNNGRNIFLNNKQYY